MPFFKKNKYNVPRTAKHIRQKTMTSSPLFEENNIKDEGLPLNERHKLAHQLIFTNDFVVLLNIIKACFNQNNEPSGNLTTVIETTEGKKDFESEEFQHLTKKGSLFRTLATRLQMAEEIKTTQYNKIFSYLHQEFFTLDQKPIALIDLGDSTSYNWILTKLEANPEKATELKESLFGKLAELMKSAQGPESNSSANETMLQTPQETKIDPVFSKEAEITQVNESTQPFIESITTSLEEVNATDNLNTQTNMSPTLSNRKTYPSTLFTLKEPSINSSFLFSPLGSSYTI